MESSARPECKGCGEYMSPRALYCSRCGLRVGGLIIEQPPDPQAGALRFLRMAVFALIVSVGIFHPLFQYCQPAIALEVHARVEQLRGILAKLMN
jgi:hypothetical protein